MQQNRLLEEERDKQKRLNEQLENATQSKLMFFTNVSHDLRTPRRSSRSPLRSSPRPTTSPRSSTPS